MAKIQTQLQYISALSNVLMNVMNIMIAALITLIAVVVLALIDLVHLVKSHVAQLGFGQMEMQLIHYFTM